MPPITSLDDTTCYLLVASQKPNYVSYHTAIVAAMHSKRLQDVLYFLVRSVHSLGGEGIANRLLCLRPSAQTPCNNETGVRRGTRRTPDYCSWCRDPTWHAPTSLRSPFPSH